MAPKIMHLISPPYRSSSVPWVQKVLRNAPREQAEDTARWAAQRAFGSLADLRFEFRIEPR
jgi:hypothetical protein